MEERRHRLRWAVAMAGALLVCSAPTAMAAAPTIDVVTPPDDPDLFYWLDELVPTEFTCSDTAPEDCAGPAEIDTSTLGDEQVLTFTAVNPDGDDEVQRTYDVVSMPLCESRAGVVVTTGQALGIPVYCDSLFDELEVVDGPQHGTLDGDPSTGLVTYLPDPGYTGLDAFTYRALRDTTGSPEAQVDLIVRAPAPGGGGTDPPDDPPAGDEPAGLGAVGDDGGSPPAELPGLPFLPSLFGGTTTAAGRGNVPSFAGGARVAPSRSARLRRDGRVRVTLRNANDFVLTGRLSVGGADAAVTLPAGRATTVALRLPRTVRERVARKGLVRVRAVLSVRAPSSAERVVRWTLTVRR